jgi:tyrosine decarboxylase/aspartate 1-decarboxylase
MTWDFMGDPRRDPLRSLEDLRARDLSYDSGRIFCSMCSKLPRIAIDAYLMFLETNLLDPRIFPSAKSLEDEAIRKIGALASRPEASGYITSGGTEGNIVALWVARKLLKRENVIAPASIHYSITKACDLQQLKLIHTALDETYHASIDNIQENVDKETLAIVVTAGTAALGLVDPIKEIAEIAKDCGCFLHVDASLGGFILPFLKNPPPWDFSIDAVSSLTIDPHKMGLAPIPAGSVLFRERSWLKTIERDPPYLNSSSSTLLGTRSGAPAAAVWALLNSLGYEGYQKMVKRCMGLTERLTKGIRKLNALDLVAEPELNIVAAKSDIIDLSTLRDRLEKMGWLISMNDLPPSIRLVVMPHHRPQHIDSFLADLCECLEDLT